jgi:hypothetical protein
MVCGNWRDYQPGHEGVRLKEDFYVFRPLLACRWIELQLVEGVLDEAGCRKGD